MAARINMLARHDFAAWDAFISKMPAATFCHRAGWKTVIEKGAGQTCPYLIATQDGDVVGVLPLSIKKHTLFGKALISNMFCVYGGAIAVDVKTEEELYNAAWVLAVRENIPVFENRSLTAKHEGVDGWVSEQKSATFVRELALDEDAQLLSIPRKQRAVVRKSLKNDLSTDWTGSVDIFYDLYARSVLGLGTPVFPKKLFVMLKEVFGDDVDIQITCDPEGQPIASLMSFYDEHSVLPYYAGGNEHARSLAAHDYMYFQLMLRAQSRGKKYFDFGRSKIDSGPYKFKKNWGFEPQTLGYEWKLSDGAALPDMSQQSGIFGHLTQLWKKLPLPVSKVLGPPIARHLG